MPKENIIDEIIDNSNGPQHTVAKLLYTTKQQIRQNEITIIRNKLTKARAERASKLQQQHDNNTTLLPRLNNLDTPNTVSDLQGLTYSTVLQPKCIHQDHIICHKHTQKSYDNPQNKLTQSINTKEVYNNTDTSNFTKSDISPKLSINNTLQPLLTQLDNSTVKHYNKLPETLHYVNALEQAVVIDESNRLLNWSNSQLHQTPLKQEQTIASTQHRVAINHTESKGSSVSNESPEFTPTSQNQLHISNKRNNIHNQQQFQHYDTNEYFDTQSISINSKNSPVKKNDGDWQLLNEQIKRRNKSFEKTTTQNINYQKQQEITITGISHQNENPTILHNITNINQKRPPNSTQYRETQVSKHTSTRVTNYGHYELHTYATTRNVKLHNTPVARLDYNNNNNNLEGNRSSTNYQVTEVKQINKGMSDPHEQTINDITKGLPYSNSLPNSTKLIKNNRINSIQNGNSPRDIKNTSITGTTDYLNYDDHLELIRDSRKTISVDLTMKTPNNLLLCNNIPVYTDTTPNSNILHEDNGTNKIGSIQYQKYPTWYTSEEKLEKKQKPYGISLPVIVEPTLAQNSLVQKDDKPVPFLDKIDNNLTKNKSENKNILSNNINLEDNIFPNSLRKIKSTNDMECAHNINSMESTTNYKDLNCILQTTNVSNQQYKHSAESSTKVTTLPNETSNQKIKNTYQRNSNLLTTNKGTTEQTAQINNTRYTMVNHAAITPAIKKVHHITHQQLRIVELISSQKSTTLTQYITRQHQ
jgi:hypothetical protein